MRTGIMCGILGGNSKKWDYSAGLNAIRHRGPDGERIEEYENFVFAFVRLSIRDLSKAAMQPMVSGDGKVAVIFNGELYGIEDMRSELMRKYCFKTTSDTEVLLNLYLEYGEAFIEKIDGMFAIAVYDSRTSRIILYRDRVGIKPLYYFYDGNNFCFSSELKGITRTCKNIEWNYDVTALYDFFSYEYIPEPKTMYKNIYKLEPAHKLIFHIEERRLEKSQKYWTLNINPYAEVKHDIRELCEEARRLILEEVKKQLVADVEVGTFLSGGVDSSIVTAVANQIRGGVKSFSIGFEIDQKIYERYDERQYAQMLTSKYGIEWVSEIFMPSELEEIYPDIVDWYDEPFGAYSCYPTYFVSGLAKKHGVTVVITGDGGDEIFGGYTRYKIFKQQENRIRLKSRLISEAYYRYIYASGKKILKKRILEDVAFYGIQVDWCCEKNQRKLLHEMGIDVPKDYDDFWYFRKYYNSDLPPVTRAQVIDFHTYLPSACLQKVDRATMQWGIEARVPLCGKEIIEFAFSLTEEERCFQGNMKGLLKCAYEEIIPHDVLYHAKKGFCFPPIYGIFNTTERLAYRKECYQMFLRERKSNV